jgi:translation initiation factor 2A
MPAKATLFDQRVKPIHEFGANPQNFVSWNPQGRLLALAGFGNLAGKEYQAFIRNNFRLT